MANPSPNTQDLLADVMTILKVPESKQPTMFQDIEHRIQLATLATLLDQLPADLQQQLESRLTPTQLANALSHHISPADFAAALEQAIRTVIPIYIATITQNATTEQQQKIDALLDQSL